jgi:hypothetical protein
MATRTLVPESLDSDISVETATDLSAKQYLFVKIDTNERLVLSGSGDSSTGILQDTPLGTSTVPVAAKVRVLGASKLILGGTVSAGDFLKPDSSGKGVAISGGDQASAKALSDGVSGDKIAVLIVHCKQ